MQPYTELLYSTTTAHGQLPQHMIEVVFPYGGTNAGNNKHVLTRKVPPHMCARVLRGTYPLHTDRTAARRSDAYTHFRGSRLHPH